MIIYYFIVVTSAYAQAIPGSADAGRLQVHPDELRPPEAQHTVTSSDIPQLDISMPENASKINIVFQGLRIENMTVFSSEELDSLYSSYIGKEIPLSTLWQFAEQISKQYTDEGYFLSRAYVPAQEIDDGIITIRVIEGYIHNVEFEGAETRNYLTMPITNKIIAQRPTHLKALEKQLLLLNNIPGHQYEAILKRYEDGPPGSISLVLKQAETKARATVSLDNHGSRYTGPHRANFVYEDSLLLYQTTQIYGSASIPGGNELWSLGLLHDIKIAPEIDLKLSLGRTISEPGYDLAINDLESQSFSWSVDLEWQAITSRKHNMGLGLSLYGRNVDTDILDTAFTRDRIRALKASLNYDGFDHYKGNNILKINVTHGIGGLGANNEGDSNLSRAAAKPDFLKADLVWQRQHYIDDDWGFQTTLHVQKSSKALYSSEEFGVGGSFIGRGYDSSEILGDQGVAAKAELYYTGINVTNDLSIVPSAFYDIGKIWNLDDGQSDDISITSAGIGLNISHNSGLQFNTQLAVPLSKSAATPLYGDNGKAPRLYTQLSYAF